MLKNINIYEATGFIALFTGILLETAGHNAIILVIVGVFAILQNNQYKILNELKDNPRVHMVWREATEKELSETSNNS